MTVATNRRPKTAVVPKQAVDQAGAFLQELPEKPKENLSLREAVDRLRDQLKAALARGYSYDDLAVMLSQRGIEISASTLKNYVPSGKRQATKEAAAGKSGPRRSRKEQSDQSTMTESLQELANIIVPAEPLSSVASEPAESSGDAELPAAPENTAASSEPETTEQPTPAPAKRGRKPGSTSKSATAANAGTESTTRQPRGRRSAATAEKAPARSTRGRRKAE